MLGISLRQGPHQVAQKVSTTHCPAKSEREVSPPSRFGRVKSAAALAG